MVDPIWSWWLTAFAVTAIWVGPRHRWGWIVGAIGQGLWFVYGIHSQQHGFVLSALLLAAGYVRNFVSAGRKRGRFKRVRASSSRAGIVRLGLARARGRLGGRPPALDEKTRALAISLYNDQNNMVKDICATLGISRSTLYRYVDQTPLER